MSNEQEKLEKQNKKLKRKNKSKGRIIILLLLILILIAALIIFLDKMAGLFGGAVSGLIFKDSGSSSSPAATSSVTETAASEETKPAESSKQVITVEISGNTYKIDGSVVTTDDIVAKVKAAGVGNVEIQLMEDSTATDDAVSILIDALTAIGVDAEYDITELKA